MNKSARTSFKQIVQHVPEMIYYQQKYIHLFYVYLFRRNGSTNTKGTKERSLRKNCLTDCNFAIFNTLWHKIALKFGF